MSEFERGQIMGYQDCELSFRDITARMGCVPMMPCNPKLLIPRENRKVTGVAWACNVVLVKAVTPKCLGGPSGNNYGLKYPLLTYRDAMNYHWQLTDFDRGRIIGFWSNRRIGRHLGRSDNRSVWQQWITEGRVYRRGGSGRPRNTNDREDRAIRRVATSAPTTSLASIQRHLPPSRHPVPSRETIRRRLTEVGLREPTSAKTLTTDPTS
ncbi:hypothetical protein TNCV_3682951 [Trichonephila clavipes]|uniref:Transposase Tc1-like domain-containing protein n=1 Tax=Trichonephila clavipes TaxID=2585209 RepID=A0A8X6V3D8_TRICX|nr:hypothetical protein TNCV_3682951 [Trichonephila clavipes]